MDLEEEMAERGLEFIESNISESVLIRCWQQGLLPAITFEDVDSMRRNEVLKVQDYSESERRIVREVMRENASKNEVAKELWYDMLVADPATQKLMDSKLLKLSDSVEQLGLSSLRCKGVYRKLWQSGYLWAVVRIYEKEQYRLSLENFLTNPEGFQDWMKNWGSLRTGVVCFKVIHDSETLDTLSELEGFEDDVPPSLVSLMSTMDETGNVEADLVETYIPQMREGSFKDLLFFILTFTKSQKSKRVPLPGALWKRVNAYALVHLLQEDGHSELTRILVGAVMKQSSKPSIYEDPQLLQAVCRVACKFRSRSLLYGVRAVMAKSPLLTQKLLREQFFWDLLVMAFTRNDGCILYCLLDKMQLLTPSFWKKLARHLQKEEGSLELVAREVVLNGAKRPWVICGAICVSPHLEPPSRICELISDKYTKETLSFIQTMADLPDRGNLDCLSGSYLLNLLWTGQRTVKAGPIRTLWRSSVAIALASNNGWMRAQGELHDRTSEEEIFSRSVKSLETCDNCGRSHEGAKLRCTCWCAWYCSKACQKQHWPKHKSTCLHVRQIQEDDARLNLALSHTGQRLSRRLSSLSKSEQERNFDAKLPVGNQERESEGSEGDDVSPADPAQGESNQTKEVERLNLMARQRKLEGRLRGQKLGSSASDFKERTAGEFTSPLEQEKSPLNCKKGRVKKGKPMTQSQGREKLKLKRREEEEKRQRGLLREIAKNHTELEPDDPIAVGNLSSVRRLRAVLACQRRPARATRTSDSESSRIAQALFN